MLPDEFICKNYTLYVLVTYLGCPWISARSGHRKLHGSRNTFSKLESLTKYPYSKYGF